MIDFSACFAVKSIIVIYHKPSFLVKVNVISREVNGVTFSWTTHSCMNISPALHSDAVCAGDLGDVFLEIVAVAIKHLPRDQMTPIPPAHT